MKVYITFGQVHVHSVNGKTFDRNCVAVIDCPHYAAGRSRAFKYFGDKWHQCETEVPDMSYFPRGLINVDKPSEVTGIAEAVEQLKSRRVMRWSGDFDIVRLEDAINAVQTATVDADLIDAAKAIVRSHFLTPDVRRLRDALVRSGIDCKISTLRAEQEGGDHDND